MTSNNKDHILKVDLDDIDELIYSLDTLGIALRGVAATIEKYDTTENWSDGLYHAFKEVREGVDKIVRTEGG